ncbi:MAG: hypothetical protein AB8B91_02385 [Rubripirellula sp.]
MITDLFGRIRVVLGCSMLAALMVTSAHAQRRPGAAIGMLGGVEPGGQYPSPKLYIALEAYRSGDLESAIDLFENALRDGRRDIHGRWIDSIPALAMLAECHYQAGDLVTTRQHLDHVAQIAIRNRGWISRVDWKSSIQVGTVAATSQRLWKEAQAVKRVPVSKKMMFSSGKRLTEADLAAGGTIEEPSLRTMDIVEIMRGLAIASYRRRVILGPLAENDPLSAGVLESTKFPADLQVPAGRALIGAMRTSGYFSNGDDKRCLTEGAKSTTFDGGVHPLTPISMLSQVSVIAGSAKPAAAVPLALTLVNYSAALNQYEFIGPALELAAGCTTPEQAGTVRQAASAVATALFRQSDLATAHALVAGADAAITGGDLDSAVTMIGQAQSMLGRRRVAQPRLSTYLSYVTARLAAARGMSIGQKQPTDLDNALNQVSAFALSNRNRKSQLVSMPRIYQLNLILQSLGGSIGGRSSDSLLKNYCDDPPAEVWRRDAVDGLAICMVDRAKAHLGRINIAASRGYAEPTLQAVDYMLAARFNQLLPLGGRIAQVRAIARTDATLLGEPAIEFQKTAGRNFKELATAAKAMADPSPEKAQALEAKAIAVALSRVHIPMSMPPLLDTKMPISKLPAKTGLLTFTSVGNKLIGTMSTNGKVVMWNVAGGSRLPGQIGKVLKGLGVGRSRGGRLPEDDSWREDAVTLRRHLLPDDSMIRADAFDELIIVPDGPLWYLPFEVLPIREPSDPLMGDKITVRYAATPGLAIKPVALPPHSRAVGLASSLFFAPRDPDLNAATVQSILDVVTDPVRIPEVTDVPSGLLGSKIGHLVVAAPRTPTPKTPFMMNVSSHDQGSPFGTLNGWMRFPATVPGSVILPGFRTAVDVGQMGSGNEVFLTLCALHSAGVRSVLMSRWAVGGESTAIVLRELLQELPFTGMNASWTRAKMLLRRSELDPTAEPLLTQADQEKEDLTGDEPLFWAGYLISSPPHPE